MSYGIDFSAGEARLSEIRREAGVDDWLEHGGDPPTDEELEAYTSALEADVVASNTLLKALPGMSGRLPD